MREKELPGTDGTIPVNDADSEGGAGSFPAEGIVIDPNLGISEEEQREILAEINRITVKNRLSLDGEKPETNKAGKKGAGDSGFRAKKKDSLFPVLVNAAAVVLLAGGVFFLSSFQGKEDVKIRESDRIYNIAEQALIEEIRRETASLLEAKESEIAVMTSKLAGVDGELQELQDSVEVMMRAKEAELRKEMSEAFSTERQRLVDQNLSEAAIVERMRQFDAERIAGMNTQLTNYRQQLDAERADSESTLKNLQEEYRSSLASLQNERSQLLESSRASEAALRTQLEAKTRELAAMTEQARSSLNDARSELDRLSSDQEKAAVIESQLGGYYIMVNDLIEKGLLTEAADILEVMREYLNTPAFQSIRSIQARRPLYAASIDLLEGVIHDLAASKVTAAPAPAPKGEEEQIIADLWRKNAELEESLENLNKAAAAAADMETGLKTQTTDLERRLAAAASAEGTLRARSTALEQQTAERERTIAALQAQNNSLTQTVAARDNTISTLQSQNNNLTQTVAARNNTISTLQSQNSSLTQTVAARDNTISTLQSQNGSLTQTVAARDNTISELRSRTTSLEETIQSLNSQLTTIRAALQALSQ